MICTKGKYDLHQGFEARGCGFCPNDDRETPPPWGSCPGESIHLPDGILLTALNSKGRSV
jgi:hypothetical protein